MVTRVVNKLLSEPNVLRFIECTRTLFIDIDSDPVCVKHRDSKDCPEHPSNDCITISVEDIVKLDVEELKNKADTGEYNKEYLLKL